jgi:competence protein ComGC
MEKIIVFLSIFVLILTDIPVYAQSTLALQDKCAEGAKKLMEGERKLPH